MNGHSALRGKTAIVGVGTAGCGEAPGFTDMELLALAAQAAVADAGLKMADIDGLATANLNAAMWPLNVVEYLGLRPRFIEGTNIGGAAFVTQMQMAAHALAGGASRSRRRRRRNTSSLHALERLDRARHPTLGVPAARPISIEELREHAVALALCR